MGGAYGTGRSMKISSSGFFRRGAGDRGRCFTFPVERRLGSSKAVSRAAAESASAKVCIISPSSRNAGCSVAPSLEEDGEISRHPQPARIAAIGLQGV